MLCTIAQTVLVRDKGEPAPLGAEWEPQSQIAVPSIPLLLSAILGALAAKADPTIAHRSLTRRIAALFTPSSRFCLRKG